MQKLEVCQNRILLLMLIRSWQIIYPGISNFLRVICASFASFA
jgi:hypothetical protein